MSEVKEYGTRDIFELKPDSHSFIRVVKKSDHDQAIADKDKTISDQSLTIRQLRAEVKKLREQRNDKVRNGHDRMITNVWIKELDVEVAAVVGEVK